MTTVQKISFVSVQPNNRMKRARTSQNRTFLANKPDTVNSSEGTVLNKFISKALGKINPALFKSSRTGKKYFALGETLAKRAANLSE